MVSNSRCLTAMQFSPRRRLSKPVNNRSRRRRLSLRHHTFLHQTAIMPCLLRYRRSTKLRHKYSTKPLRLSRNTRHGLLPNNAIKSHPPQSRNSTLNLSCTQRLLPRHRSRLASVLVQTPTRMHTERCHRRILSQFLCSTSAATGTVAFTQGIPTTCTISIRTGSATESAHALTGTRTTRTPTETRARRDTAGGMSRCARETIAVTRGGAVDGSTASRNS